METEMVYDSTTEYTEPSIEPEIETETEAESEPESELKSEPETESGAETETDFKAEPESLEETGSSPKEETRTILSEDESRKEAFSEDGQELFESGTADLPDVQEDRETNTFSPAISSGSRSGTPGILDQLDVFTFSEIDEGTSIDWQENLAACRSSLASCVSLLLFGDIVLCLLLGCLCASIFSRFWKVNR